jgi:hypothetical protein
MERRRKVEGGMRVGKRARVGEPKMGCHIRVATSSHHCSTNCLVSTCGTAVLWSLPVENLCDYKPTAICYPQMEESNG